MAGALCKSGNGKSTEGGTKSGGAAIRARAR
jgi:hypothetical protein